MSDQPINLHTLSAFSKVEVANDLILVPLDKSHGFHILDILKRDPEIRRRVTVASRMISSKDIEAEIEAIEQDEGLIRFILLKNNLPIGMISFWRNDGFWGETNFDDYGFGFFLDPKERGKGYTSQAIESLIATAKQQLFVRQFIAFCEDDNVQSISVLKRLGFQPTDETFTEPSRGWVERKYVL